MSRAASIPTGWEVLEDLISQIATLQGETITNDPAAWYKEKFGEDPDYSKVLDAVAKTPAERSQLLRKYFEPTEEERERNEKIPTPAHKAIAQLVACGYIRVIVTTNFDRLMESALEEVGISPVVISTADGIKGAPPLAHSTCTIIKLHGDYTDTRIRNTIAELGKYDSATNKLLDQVFDEYGLVICGWSGEWDIALKAAMQRCKSNRFTTYWTTRNKLSITADDLAKLRKAQIVKIAGANEFFTGLEQKISALEEYDRPHPLSVKTAVVQLKRNLAEDKYRIQLHDLVTQETEKVKRDLDENYPTQLREVTYDDCFDRLKRYEASTELLLALLANGTYFGEQKHTTIWAKSLTRVATYGDTQGLVFLIELKRYPVLLLMYAAGIAAIEAGRYETLKTIFGVMEKEHYKDAELAIEHANAAIVSADQGNAITKSGQRLYTPISEHVLKYMQEHLQDLIPAKDVVEEAFDRYECLLAMKMTSLALANGTIEPWFPHGRFVWKHRNRGDDGTINKIEKEIQDQTDNWPAVKAGIFPSSADALASIQSVKTVAAKSRWF